MPKTGFMWALKRVFVVAFIGATVAILGVYVLFNLLLITFVPLLHRFTLVVRVEDQSSGTPISGAAVAWVGPFEKVLGTTDTNGEIRIPMLMQDQPLWAIPTIGSHGFKGRTLKIVKNGYREIVLPLSSRVSHSQEEVVITVKMAPEEKK